VEDEPCDHPASRERPRGHLQALLTLCYMDREDIPRSLRRMVLWLVGALLRVLPPPGIEALLSRL
jgi:hypothetical protein